MPRGYEASIAAKAGTAAARKADHEREAITGRIPHLDVLDGSDDAAELHGAPQGNEHVYWRNPMSAGARPAKEPAIRDGPSLGRKRRESRDDRKLRTFRPGRLWLFTHSAAATGRQRSREIMPHCRRRDLYFRR